MNVGKHLIADVYECEGDLDDMYNLIHLLKTSLLIIGVTILDVTYHKFEPYGCTILFLLSESHLSIHTWPELRYASLDIYTCNPNKDPTIAYEYIRSVLSPLRDVLRIIDRG